jgi:hypothetical protein
LTIRPHPAVTIAGPYVRHIRKTPSTLTANVFRHAASSTSKSAALGPMTPALLIKMSTSPVWRCNSATESASETSTWKSAPARCQCRDGGVNDAGEQKLSHTGRLGQFTMDNPIWA